MMTIAVLSDTHGLLRPDIPTAIKDVDHIIHAGDLGKMELLDEMATVLTRYHGANYCNCGS